MIHAQGHFKHGVHDTDFKREKLIVIDAQSEALALILAPRKQLAQVVDGGASVNTSIDLFHVDVFFGSEGVSTEQRVGNLLWLIESLHLRSNAEDAEAPDEDVAILVEDEADGAATSDVDNSTETF